MLGVTTVYLKEDTVFFPFDHVTVAVPLREVPEGRVSEIVPWAGGRPALVLLAPEPVQPEMVPVLVSALALAEVALSAVQLTVSGAAEAIPPGSAAAASEADPAMAAQTPIRVNK